MAASPTLASEQPPSLSSPKHNSPFLTPSTHTTPNTLAILHLRRDALVPTVLLPSSDTASATTGYVEGHVATTRFGSYPHSTLTGIPWGTQVLASKVDTGTRGRPPKQKQKQKRGNDAQASSRDDEAHSAKRQRLDDTSAASVKHDNSISAVPAQPQAQTRTQTPIQAASGFTHVLPPTPEAWTASLPHRTQVVYTPDYSYVLQAMRVRPGNVVLEAGGGSGSFAHAAARAVFSGYCDSDEDEKVQNGESVEGKRRRKRQRGRVYTYEYHEPRAQQLVHEIREHGLQSVVKVTHRDVYADGFCLDTSSSATLSAKSGPEAATMHKHTDAAAHVMTEAPIQTEDTNAPPPTQRNSPLANAIFLDLPAPWRCLPHLTRASTTTTTSSPSPSPLNPTRPAHLTAFLPCIEQTTKLLSALRQHGWVELRMVSLEHRRVEVRRERVGLGYVGERGVIGVAGCVGESLERLRRVEGAGRKGRGGDAADREIHDEGKGKSTAGKGKGQGKGKDAGKGKDLGKEKQKEERKPWTEGRLITRTEGEIKSHTGYLVMGVLPVAWVEAEEKALRPRQEKAKQPKAGAAKNARKDASSTDAGAIKTEGRTKTEDQDIVVVEADGDVKAESLDR